MGEPGSGKDSVGPLPGGLYLVATPIGTADDITLRALDILRRADVIAAEDTRRTQQLLGLHGIALGGRAMIAYHDHNGAAQRPRLLARLAEGQSVALVSDAGTPLIADPGWPLVQAAIAAELPVTAAPGASSALVALSLSGLPSDRFMFAGFPPTGQAERQRWLSALATVPATLILFESPHRLAASLDAMRAAFGNRPAAICRELTKRFEEVIRGELDTLTGLLAQRGRIKGEIVVVVGGPAPQVTGDNDLDAALKAALETGSIRDAVHAVAAGLGVPRKRVYQRALALTEGGAGDAVEETG